MALPAGCQLAGQRLLQRGLLPQVMVAQVPAVQQMPLDDLHLLQRAELQVMAALLPAAREMPLAGRRLLQRAGPQMAALQAVAAHMPHVQHALAQLGLLLEVLPAGRAGWPPERRALAQAAAALAVLLVEELPGRYVGQLQPPDQLQPARPPSAGLAAQLPYPSAGWQSWAISCSAAVQQSSS